MANDKHSEFLVRFTKAQTALRSYVFAHIRDFHEAEDVYQNVALALWNSYERYQPDRSFEAWSFGVARNIVLASRRKMGRRHMVLVGDIAEQFEERLIESSPAFDRCQVFLKQCLEKLPEKSRKLVEMRYDEQLATDSIAARIGSTANALRILLCRVRRTIAECMAKAARQDEREGSLA